MAMKRKYPVGIQSFETIRRDGYMYVDKIVNAKANADEESDIV